MYLLGLCPRTFWNPFVLPNLFLLSFQGTQNSPRKFSPHWNLPCLSCRKPRGEGKKCRKVYGMENRDMWCTACRWKKACQRFIDWDKQGAWCPEPLLTSPPAASAGESFFLRNKTHSWSPGEALPGTLVELEQKKQENHHPHCSYWESKPEQLKLFIFCKRQVNLVLSI